MAVIRINKFVPAAEKTEALWSFLVELQQYISQSGGCIYCEVYRKELGATAGSETKPETQHNFVVIEKWQSKTDHQQSLASFPKDKMQAAMPLIVAPPEGEYYTCD